ncbi:hypothetical protein FB451DRAFT_1303034, partial [Mycena latifolia]
MSATICVMSLTLLSTVVFEATRQVNEAEWREEDNDALEKPIHVSAYLTTPFRMAATKRDENRIQSLMSLTEHWFPATRCTARTHSTYRGIRQEEQDDERLKHRHAPR